jgi:hypothetical protein
MDTTDREPRRCDNCDADIVLGHRYCGICGQQYGLRRLTLHDIAHDMLHALVHVDRSALFLLRMLLLQPGVVARNYVQGKRKRYFGPFSFLVVVVAVASAAIALSGFHPVYSNRPNAVADFLQSHINLLVFADLPLLAAFSRLLDLRGCFNLAEHLVLAAYTSGIRVIFATLILIPLWYAFHADNVAAVALASLAVWALYFGFATSQFLPGGGVLSWVKGISAAVLAAISLQVLVTLVASMRF